MKLNLRCLNRHDGCESRAEFKSGNKSVYRKPAGTLFAGMKASALLSGCWVAASILASLIAFPTRGADSMPILPLSEIKPGMTGEWHTVVSGTRIDSFPMEVVGVVDNFIGPRRPVIICKGLDAANKLTGPVAGMSGSPVFIQGKLIGAYAYGFLYPKDQALFGVTPIEDMLEVETNYFPASGSAKGKGMAGNNAGAGPRWVAAPAVDAEAPPLDALPSMMKPLPTPLFVSGVSERTLRKFSAQLDRLGLQLLQAPSGGVSHPIDTDLQPGSAVAGVLMSGDFHFAGTGTVTWRQGNRILAFGHPFLQNGPIEMPMAAAEILTVVQSSVRSFKLSNTGPVVGSIYQDRLTAIAGEIGRKAPTTHVEVHLQAPGGAERVFQAEMFEHQMFSPILSAISLLESLEATMETEEEQTIYLDTTLEIAGHDPVKLSETASGAEAGFTLALRQLSLYQALLANPCEIPKVKSLVFHARLAEGWKSSQLDSLELDRTVAKPDSVLHAVIGVRNYRGEPASIPIAIPLPPYLRAPEVQLFVGDADAAQQMDDPPRVPPQTLDQVLARLRQTRSHGTVSVKLLRNAPGIGVEGQKLPDLPPSAIAQFASPNASFQKAALNKITLWETNFPVEGTFSGQKTLPVRIE